MLTGQMQQMIINMLKQALGGVDLEQVSKRGIEEYQLLKGQLARIEQNQQTIIAHLEALNNDGHGDRGGEYRAPSFLTENP